ncbi:MAG: hypothetical protein DCF19_22925 [Pseudanabaena frigida]|uniref:Uncharacterized protein n=1 Tax=Pseudanabaena frigida TaxID=945775 RepID=A0A2W4XMQ8_9CYAN|nr:MAG: hypothetical protein DCF19_22925 [Pseudanabaena frigida]
MNDKQELNDISGESELFHLGGKTSNFVIVPAQIRHHHIKVDDLEKPVAAIAYNGFTYSLFRTSADWGEVEKLTSRLSAAYAITVIKKGWAIWVFEY